MGVLAVVIAVTSLLSVPVAGQAPSSAAKKPTAASTLRTPDGQPDLQGLWNFATVTPLQRPSELAGKDVLTDEEVAAVETVAAQGRIDRAPREGDPGAYNQFWFDRGTKVIGTRRSSLIVDPPDGRLPPLTPEAQKRATARTEAGRRPAAGPEDRNLGERCIMGFNAGPPMIPSAYNNIVQLLQTPQYVVILNEMVHNARIVPLDGRPRGTIRQWSGDSRGRWEGNTLVVETTNFRNEGVGLLPLQSAGDGNLNVVERFTRADADTLLYEFTVNDPTVWTKPWTAAVPMTKSQEPMYEYACHEGNYGMFGILAGARADEKATEEAAKTGLR
jgi:hypothetical protein